MSALTKNERDGLEDVFLSIHAKSSKFQKINEISTFIIDNEMSINLIKLLKQAKTGAKGTNFTHYFANLLKKKKNLSK